jgi:DNA polymerase-4
MMQALKPLIAKVWQHCETTKLSARTLTVKIKYADFRQVTRSRSCINAFTSAIDLEELTLSLLRPILPTPKGIRLLGVSLSSLISKQTEPVMPAQLSLGL